MGTAELSVASLEALIHWPGCEMAAVVTQPDRPKGRDLRLQAPPVKEIALASGLPVLQPERARSLEFIEELQRLRPDLIVVAAYGQILPPGVLDIPRFGCLNVHTSLLPKYRGAAPIQWALLNDEPETGVTIMKMDVGMDTGDILTQERTPIEAQDNAETLYHRLARLGAALLVRTIPDWVAGRIAPQPQLPSEATHAPKIKKEDGHIDWTQSARAIWSRARALVPWPGAFCFLPGSPRPLLLKVWQVEVNPSGGEPGEILCADKAGIVVGCGQQAVSILQLQREGGRRLTPQEFLAGCPLRVGTRLQ